MVKKLPYPRLIISAVIVLLIFFAGRVIAQTIQFTTVGANVPTDIDGDGMPNDWEITYGLDPADPSDAGDDTDSDGLVNLEEYNRGTDPTNSDTDGGGLNDGDEVDQGKDPLDPSDDGIPVLSNVQVSNVTTTSATITWETNELADSFVGYSPIPANYSQTVSDGTLVTLHMIILTGLTPGTTYYFMVSSTDIDSDTGVSINDSVQRFTTTGLPPTPTVVPTPGSTVTPQPTATTVPIPTVTVIPLPSPFEGQFGVDDPQGDPDNDGLINIDEYTYGTNPLKYDTDGDGINDYDEIFKYGTNPNLKDTDRDGLSDLDEVVIYKTDPLDWDTDDGGVSDGDEVANGTDPLNPIDDLPLDLKIYIGDEPNDIFTFLTANKVDIPHGTDLSVEFPLPSGVTGVVVSYGESIYYSEEQYIKLKLKSPPTIGLTLLKIQLLDANGFVSQVSKFVEVRKRGVVQVDFTGFFEPLYWLVPYLRDGVVSGVTLELQKFIESSQSWETYDTSVFGMPNPQISDENGEYVFVGIPQRYRLIATRVDLGAKQQDFVITNKHITINAPILFNVNGDLIFVLFILAVLLGFVVAYFVVKRVKIHFESLDNAPRRQR